MTSSDDSDRATLVRAIDFSLQGDAEARRFLEDLSTPDLSAGIDPLLSLWKVSLDLFTSSPDGTPHAYFIACVLRRNVRQQWDFTPSQTRTQLAKGTWETLIAYAEKRAEIPPQINSSRGVLSTLIADPAVNQLISVVVAQAVAIEDRNGEAHAATRQLISMALSHAGSVNKAQQSLSTGRWKPVRRREASWWWACGH
ncbi:hypothetical protein Naga_100296g6 [Nannochloropsis gaditana]|uniref:Uncharacterized protein n=1 Tax=Nannochloropsis gaditana TaxID=72520 RepID=W7TL16_9STRA|nr:hypothetical protein Naga_100296g6 [Nannochloropsis gaditana]